MALAKDSPPNSTAQPLPAIDATEDQRVDTYASTLQLAILPAPPGDTTIVLSDDATAVSCGWCGREGDAARPLLTCSRCHAASYCGAKHQRRHWLDVSFYYF